MLAFLNFISIDFDIELFGQVPRLSWALGIKTLEYTIWTRISFYIDWILVKIWVNLFMLAKWIRINKPGQLATSGDDCQVKFWDKRKLSAPIYQLSDHTHWIWSIAYNQSHDQLLLTSSSDCKVNLQSIISISSSSFDETLSQHSQEATAKPVDGLVHSYDQHEESVYHAAWSPADPWLFASLSYDGRVLINFVPSEHKYKIIL